MSLERELRDKVEALQAELARAKKTIDALHAEASALREELAAEKLARRDLEQQAYDSKAVGGEPKSRIEEFFLQPLKP